MKILISAFDPFGGDLINPALEAVKLMKDEISGAQIVKLEVPTVFNKCIDKVVEAIHKEKPDVVLNIGQAGGRFEVTPERVAINVDDARIKDNEGKQPIDKPIYEDGEPAYFSTLPVKAMVENVRAHGLPCSVSYSAGTYVCNSVMYRVLHLAARSYPNMKAGFIHVPYSSEQVANKDRPLASMPIEIIAKSLEHAIEAVVKE